MAKSVVNQTKPANAAAPGAAQPGNRNPTNLLIFGGVVLGLACVQIVVTSLLMPGAAQPQSKQTQKRQEESEQVAPGPDSDEKSAASGFAEVALGDFSFSNTIALRGVTTHVDFRLAALAAPTQVATLESQINRSNQGRIREVINKIVRNCNLDELNDPNLDAMRRQIREGLNELLGKRLIIDLMINDIRIIQQ
jgi:hypothetical protein